MPRTNSVQPEDGAASTPPRHRERPTSSGTARSKTGAGAQKKQITKFLAGGGTVQRPDPSAPKEDPSALDKVIVVSSESEAEGPTPMDKDDSMYHGKIDRNRVDGGSTSSIIRTRSATRASEKDSQIADSTPITPDRSATDSTLVASRPKPQDGTTNTVPTKVSLPRGTGSSSRSDSIVDKAVKVPLKKPTALKPSGTKTSASASKEPAPTKKKVAIKSPVYVEDSADEEADPTRQTVHEDLPVTPPNKLPLSGSLLDPVRNLSTPSSPTPNLSAIKRRLRAPGPPEDGVNSDSEDSEPLSRRAKKARKSVRKVARRLTYVDDEDEDVHTELARSSGGSSSLSTDVAVEGPVEDPAAMDVDELEADEDEVLHYPSDAVHSDDSEGGREGDKRMAVQLFSDDEHADLRRPEGDSPDMAEAIDSDSGAGDVSNRSVSVRDKGKGPARDASPTPSHISVSSDSNVTFAQALGLPTEDEAVSQSSDEAGGLVYEDLLFYRVRSLPKVCEVMHKKLQDPVLKKFYAKPLPCLRLGYINSWSEQEGKGMVKFSDWGKSCPSMRFLSCLSIIEFRRFGRYVNLCRISPMEVLVKQVPGARIKYHLYGTDRKHLINLAAVLSRDSFILAPRKNGVQNKWMSGVFHTQEWERFVGFIRTTFDHESLDAQLYQDAIQFGTRSPSSGARKDASSSMYTNQSSPSTRLKKASESGYTSNDPYTLGSEDNIPVYDCRGFNVDFTRDLDKLDTFPLWKDEIPRRSFVVVAHTVTVFKTSAGSWSLGLNILWAMILGIPTVVSLSDD